MNGSHKVYVPDLDNDVLGFFLLNLSTNDIGYFDMVGLGHHHITSDLTTSVVKNSDTVEQLAVRTTKHLPYALIKHSYPAKYL